MTPPRTVDEARKAAAITEMEYDAARRALTQAESACRRAASNHLRALRRLRELEDLA